MIREGALVAGIGFARTATDEEIAILVRTSLGGRAAALLAVPAGRARLPQAATAAALLGLELAVVDPSAIAAAQPRCPTPPGRAGLAVAEGAALAAAGEGARIVVPRTAGPRVTCAVARGMGE